MKNATRFDLSQYLDSEEMIQAYLNHVLAEGDQDELNRALGYIAKARGGMTQIAKKAGLGRESIYKAIRPGSKPQFDTVVRIAHASGFSIRFGTEAQEQAATELARTKAKLERARATSRALRARLRAQTKGAGKKAAKLHA